MQSNYTNELAIKLNGFYGSENFPIPSEFTSWNAILICSLLNWLQNVLLVGCKMQFKIELEAIINSEFFLPFFFNFKMIFYRNVVLIKIPTTHLSIIGNLYIFFFHCCSFTCNYGPSNWIDSHKIFDWPAAHKQDKKGNPCGYISFAAAIG